MLPALIVFYIVKASLKFMLFFPKRARGISRKDASVSDKVGKEKTSGECCLVVGEVLLGRGYI